MIRCLLLSLSLLGFSVIVFGEDKDHKPSPVVVSIQPLALIVQQVVGELLPVEVLINGSVNPHDYVMRPSDIQLLNQASAIYWVGPGVDGFLAKPMSSRPFSEKSVELSLLEGIQWPDLHSSSEHVSSQVAHDGHDHNGLDAHIWLNPHNAGVIALAVAKQLAGTGVFSAQESQQMLDNAVAGEQRWSALIENWRPRLAQHRHFSAYHQAYGHFAQAFNLIQDAVVTKSPEQQPGAKHLWALNQQLNGSQCLLVEPYYTRALPHKLQKSTGVHLVDIDLLAVNANYKNYEQWLEVALLRPLLDCLAGREG